MTFEIVSPKGWDIQVYLDEYKELGLDTLVDAVNIPNNPTARVKADPVPYGMTILRDLDKDVIPHLTCRDDTIAGMQRWMLGAHAAGIRNLLVMTGDHPTTGDYPAEKRVDSINTLELITGIKKFLNKGYMMPDIVLRAIRHKNRYDPDMEKIDRPTEFTVGAVLLPSRAKEAEYAAKKIRAGADFFHSQITFDPLEVVDFLSFCIDNDINFEPPVFMSLGPIGSLPLLKFMKSHIPNLVINDQAYHRLRNADDILGESIDLCAEIAGNALDLVKERGISTKIGIHIVPIDRMQAGAKIAARIREEVL